MLDGEEAMEQREPKYCVLVSTLNVRDRSYHQGEVLEEGSVRDLLPLLLNCGYLAKAEELPLTSAFNSSSSASA